MQINREKNTEPSGTSRFKKGTAKECPKENEKEEADR